MNITVIGTGYVGLVTGACFAKMGNDVYCVDIDDEKIEGLKNNVLPIFEPNLDTLVRDSQNRGDLHFTTDIKEAEISFGNLPLRSMSVITRKWSAHMISDAEASPMGLKPELLKKNICFLFSCLF